MGLFGQYKEGNYDDGVEYEKEAGDVDEDEEDDSLQKEILEDPEFRRLWETLEPLFLESLDGADKFLRIIISNPRACQLLKIIHLATETPVDLTDGRKCLYFVFDNSLLVLSGQRGEATIQTSVELTHDENLTPLQRELAMNSIMFRNLLSGQLLAFRPRFLQRQMASHCNKLNLEFVAQGGITLPVIAADIRLSSAHLEKTGQNGKYLLTASKMKQMRLRWLNTCDLRIHDPNKNVQAPSVVNAIDKQSSKKPRGRNLVTRGSMFMMRDGRPVISLPKCRVCE